MAIDHLWGRDVRDIGIIEAMLRVPRQDFVDAEHRKLAYDDAPLPIGHDQTISQPYIVAKMSELARIQPGDRVLEIGSGSGYQTAMLLELGAEVHSLEIIEDLADAARRRLARLGYERFEVFCRDGYDGLPERAPFAAIVLTAAPWEPPPPLFDQLAEGGRMVCPVGPTDNQTLYIYTRRGDTFPRERIFPVRFVPMTGRIRRGD